MGLKARKHLVSNYKEMAGHLSTKEAWRPRFQALLRVQHGSPGKIGVEDSL